MRRTREEEPLNVREGRRREEEKRGRKKGKRGGSKAKPGTPPDLLLYFGDPRWVRCCSHLVCVVVVVLFDSTPSWIELR